MAVFLYAHIPGVLHRPCSKRKDEITGLTDRNENKTPMDLEEFEEQLVYIFTEYEEVVENFSANVLKSIELLERLKAKVSECKQI